MSDEEDCAELSVATAAVLLEERMRQRYGEKWERQYQRARRKLEEQTESEEQQFHAMLFLLGQSCQPAELILGCVWLARVQLRDPLLVQRVQHIRQQPLRVFLSETEQLLRGAHGESLSWNKG